MTSRSSLSPKLKGGGYSGGVPFSKSPVKDGQEVWSAGFPGLGGEPVWQFGKGTVTNSSARIKELIDPSISTVIQHSAEIDRGNSGGPLLVAAANSAGYAVVGVNTWKAAYRQNTNFAVPVSAILEWIKNLKNESNESEEKSVRGKSREFISALNGSGTDFAQIAKCVSLETALSSGTQDFVSAMKFAPSEARNLIAREFEQTPVNGLKCAVAYRIWQKYGSAESDKKFEIVSTEKKSDGYEVSLASSDGTEITALWKKANGEWKISEVAPKKSESETTENSEGGAKTKKGKKSSSSGKSGIEPPSLVDINAGAVFVLSDGGKGFGAGVDWWFKDYFGAGLAFERSAHGGEAMTLFGAAVIARLPYSFSGKVNIALLGRAGIGMLRFGTENKFGYFLEPAFEFIYSKPKVKPGLGISFRYADSLVGLSLGDDSFYGARKKTSSSALKVYAKIAF